MSKPKLVIGNTNYSSWSLRPFMSLHMAGIPHDLQLIRFGDGFNQKIRRISKANRVPVLIHGELKIWDSLAILEYIAERWPTKNLWPKLVKARAHARSISAEMHAGFHGIRGACPMNIRRTPKAVAFSGQALADVQRVAEIWTDCRKLYAKDGPYLFGKFSNADAMYAPMASRFRTFEFKLPKSAANYVDTILGSPGFIAWESMARKEPWIVADDEVD